MAAGDLFPNLPMIVHHGHAIIIHAIYRPDMF